MIKKIRRIINNEYAFSIVAKVFGVVTGLLYSILYSRYMQAELRGEAGVVTNYAELAMLVLCFGMYQAYPYFRKNSDRPIYRDYINMISGVFLLYEGIGLAIILLLRPPLNVCVTIELIPLMFAVKELNYCVLIENPKSRNTSAMVLNTIDIVIILVLMMTTEANLAICFGFLIGKELIAFAAAVYRLKVNVLSIRPTLRGSGAYIRFGILPMLTSILMEINYKADVAMLDWFRISKADIGIYTLGVSLAQKIWMIPDAMKDILVSKLAKGKDQDEVAKVTRISLGVVLVFVIALIALGQPFVNILYGAEFSGAYQVLVILLLGIIGMVFYKMVYSYNVINRHKVANLVMLGIAALANIGANALMIPRFGITGAAVASTVSYVICGLCFLVFFCRKTGVPMLHMLLIRKEDFRLLKKLLSGK